MSAPLVELIEILARRKAIRLPPGWSSAAPKVAVDAGPEALGEVLAALDWEAPQPLRKRPRAHEFPALIYAPDTGWGLAEQWRDEKEIRVLTSSGIQHVEWIQEIPVYEVPFPKSYAPQPTESSRQIFWSSLLRRKRMLTEATIATVVINIIALLTSLYSMQIYDRVIPRSGFDTLWVLTVGMLFALVIDFVIRNARAHMVDREAAAIDSEVSEHFFSRMQSVRLDSRPPGIGTMAGQLKGLEQIRSMMASTTMFLLADLPFAFLFMAVMWSIGGAVTFVPAILFPLSLGMAFLFSRLIRGDSAKAQVSSNRKNGLLVETLDAAETLKANLGSWHMLASWNRLIDDVHDHEQKVRRWSTLASSLFSLLQQVGYVGIVAWGAYRISQGEMTMGGLIACTILSSRINGPLVASLPNLIVQWSYTRAALDALDNILKLPSDHTADQARLRPEAIAPQLRLENVQFAHAGARFQVEVPNLEIRPGEHIGLIGPVGSGKSSLLRLLAGLYATQRGHVLLDGTDITQIAEDDLRRHVCYVPQDYRLIKGTLRDNLSLGISTPSDSELMTAAQRTGLSELIKQHPKGLDLPIAEGGSGMSGGQKMLVALTRALLLKPCLLLLDEPTASLDHEAEARVLRALLENLPAESTLVLVTHKIQLLSLVGRVLFLNNGRIVLDGPTQGVLEKLRNPGAAS